MVLSVSLSVEVQDAIYTTSALSGIVSVDITRIPETINIVADTVKQPLLQDRNLLAALLTCIGEQWAALSTCGGDNASD